MILDRSGLTLICFFDPCDRNASSILNGVELRLIFQKQRPEKIATRSVFSKQVEIAFWCRNVSNGSGAFRFMVAVGFDG